MTYQAPPIPSAFIWRRAHSFTGLWLVLFLIQHLLTNSLSVLLIGENGKGFISAVNSIKSLPYLPFIELGLLGVPFLVHAIWGIRYLMTGQSNSTATDGSLPNLSHLPKNRAYSWQRITSWILLVGIFAHVIHMRFLEYPTSVLRANQELYILPLENSDGLQRLSYRWNFQLLNSDQIYKMVETFRSRSKIESSDNPIQVLKDKQENLWISAISHKKLGDDQRLAVVDNFGLASLLMLRETFKNPIMVLLYTGLVLAACFHAFNGLWTFMISWGITLTSRSQATMRTIAVSMMILVTFFGLAAVWGNYWIY
jgi:succinate dehydrogenase / fumarate reductase, cytochrome b subunit